MSTEFENCEVIAETEKGCVDKGSILVNIEGNEVWIPKNQVHVNSEVYRMDTEGTLIITDWIAEKRGLV